MTKPRWPIARQTSRHTPLTFRVSYIRWVGSAGLEEVAEVVAFLASDRASNTTESYVLSDGGYTAQ
jgi:hypothetical protein